jgi:hypothetical protein
MDKGPYESDDALLEALRHAFDHGQFTREIPPPLLWQMRSGAWPELDAALADLPPPPAHDEE